MTHVGERKWLMRKNLEQCQLWASGPGLNNNNKRMPRTQEADAEAGGAL